MIRTTAYVVPARQRGNTLTGVIIGLIIGLVIAVIVALAITKGATPFTDKSGKLGKMSGTAEVADPNKPMYSDKQAAREANKQFAGKPKPVEGDPLAEVIAGLPADTAATEKAAEKAVEKAAEKAAEKAVEKAPVAPVVEAPRPAAPPAAPPADASVVYFLQAGAFRDLTDAENTRAKLALLGFEAAITDLNNDSGVLHRVRIGPYGQVEAMNKARAKLLDSGIDVAIVRNQKQPQ